MRRLGTVFVHVPLSHTFTIQFAGGDGNNPHYVSQAGRTCGLREGDVVMGLNGTSTSSWSLALLQQTLRKASRDVVVEVLREMGDSTASVGVRAGGTELGIKHHHTITKAVHETEDLPDVSENGKVEPCVESPEGAPASPASLSASPPCSQSMTPAANPDTEAQTVASSQTSHTSTSFESAVSLQGTGSGPQDTVQPQAVQNFSGQSQSVHSQSIQSGIVSQSQDATINGHSTIQTTTATSGQQPFQSVQSVSQTQSTQSAQTVVQSQAAVVTNNQPPCVLQAPADQPRLESPSVDENANSIREKSPTQPQPEPVPEVSVAKEPTEQLEPVAAPVTAVIPEPATTSEPTSVPETAAVPVPAVVAPEPVIEPKPTEAAAVPESAMSSEEAVMQDPAAPSESIVVEPMDDVQECTQNHESEPVAATEETLVPESQLPQEVLAKEAPQAAVTEPVPVVQPELSVQTEQVTVPEQEPSVVTTVSGGGGGGGPVVEEISQEHIKEQLHEIITEIEQQVLPEQEQEQQQHQEEVQQGGGEGGVAKRHTKPSEEAQPVVEEAGRPLEAEEVKYEYYDEDGVLKHTWKPKGKYEVPKTVIQYEDVVPIPIPDVTISLKAQAPKPAPPPPQPEPPKPQPQPRVETHQEHSNLTNGAVSPIEIPEGIPLLARILPKDHEDGERKISLERLFTPATDSGDLTPKRSPSKKAFSSSSFYRPDHPTIDDQVELAQRISFSLVDENNKTSRGQSMYMKRKKRSMRWIHAGSAEGGEGQEEEHLLKHPPMTQRPASVPAVHLVDTKKPPMKLLMSPKGVQDFHAVQEHYQALMDQAVPTSPEVVDKIVAEVQSPTGKGAELFAKRKKRMDKFIVDETTVQKAQTTTRPQQQQQTVINDLGVKKSAVEERNRQQHQIMGSLYKPASSERPELASTVVERADTKLAEASWLEPPKPMPLVAPTLTPELMASPVPAPSSGSFTLPDLTKILTQPSKPKSSKPKLEPNKPKPVPPKPKAWHSVNRAGSDDSPTPVLRGGSQRTPACPALTSTTCSPKPLPLPPPPPPPPRTYTSPESFSLALKASCKFNKSPAVTHSDGSRSVVSPKLAVSPASPPVAPRPASASTTASGASGRFPARPVAFPKPVPAVASGMKHFVVLSPRTSVESPIQEGTNFPCTSQNSSFQTPSLVPQIPKCISSSSSPASSPLAFVPGAELGDAGGSGGAFKISLTSGSGRPNTMPSYFTSSPTPPTPPPPPPRPSLAIGSPPPVPPRTNYPTSSYTIDEKEIELRHGTPPLYVFPDGTELSYLNENTLNHYTENCSTEEVHHEDCLSSPGGKDPLAAVDLPTQDATTSGHLGINTEVSRLTEATAHSTRIDILSTLVSESTGTSTDRLESHGPNSNMMNNLSIFHNSSSRPARPTSLPLFSLSSLVNNLSLASPASLPGNSATSPLVSPAYPGARSFSDVAFRQNLIGSEASFPCVVAADPCVGSQVAGVSVITPASPLPGPLPDISLTFPSHVPASSTSIYRSIDAPNSPENGNKDLPVKMKSQKVYKENNPESLPDGQDHQLEVCPINSGLIHATKEEELEFYVSSARESASNVRFSSSCVVNKDSTNMINKTLTQSHEENHRMNSQSFLDSHLSDNQPPNFFHGIPLIEISNEPRKASLEEEELRKFMEEIKTIFQSAPSLIDTIDVDDLKPPEYYRSVSRDSMDQEVEDLHNAAGHHHLADPFEQNSGGRLILVHGDTQDKGNLVSDKCEEKMSLKLPCAGFSGTADDDQCQHKKMQVESCDVHGGQAEVLIDGTSNDFDDVRCKKAKDSDREGRDQAEGELRSRFSLQNCMVFTGRCYSPTNKSPSPPLSPLSTSTNPPTPFAGPAAIYSAEVKVVMRSSQPPTPAMDVPRSMFSPEDSDNKRNSASFNMAAKGWGTYNKFYTPVTFAT